MANDETKDEVQLKDASRRTLLKAATVAGGAVAASALLPGSWRKPVATVGGLPAHAQTSQTITIRNVAASFESWPVPPPPAAGQLAAPIANPDTGVYCEYEDTLGDFDLSHRVTYRVTLLENGSAPPNGACGQQFTYTLRDIVQAKGYWDGNKNEGRLWLALYGGCFPPDRIFLSIHKGAAHVSNEVGVKIKLVENGE